MTNIFLDGGAGKISPDSFNALMRMIKADSLREGGAFDDGVKTSVFQRRVDSRLDSILPSARKDAAGNAGGTLTAGKLRHVYNEILAEERPTPNGFRLFSPDTSVPLGARSHEVEREFHRGEVKTWAGTADDTPTIQSARLSATFKVHHYITSVLWDYFEELADSFSKDNGRVRRLLMGATELMEQYANQRIWHGDPDGGLFGVLNYPWVTRLTVSGNWHINVSTGSLNTDDYSKELSRFVNYPTTQSKMVFNPTRLAIGSKMDEFMRNTLIEKSGAMLPMTLMEKFLKSNPWIKSESQIDVVWELDDAFGEGVSGILAYRPEADTIANVIPGGGVQNLPLIEKDYMKVMPMFMAHGGIVMRRVGSVVVGFVDTSDPNA